MRLRLIEIIIFLVLVTVYARADFVNLVEGTAGTVTSGGGETYFGISGMLGGLSSLGSTLDSAVTATHQGAFVDIVCTTDLNLNTCENGPTYNVQNITTGQLGTPLACLSVENIIGKPETSVVINPGDIIGLVRTANGAGCDNVFFSVQAHVQFR